MRTLTIPLLMAALSATASQPDKMFVVVHTTDKVVVYYVCSSVINDQTDVPVLGSYLRSTGGYDWHVVGGVAPFTVVKNEMRTQQSGCITVMDAEGTTATGCGMIGTRQERQPVNCQGMEDVKGGPYGLVPNDSTDAARSAWQNPPVAPDPGDTYVPPVRGPLPIVEPPVDPKPPISVKPERRTPSPSPKPNNPPPVHHKDVVPSSKIPEVGTGHGPWSLDPRTGGPSGSGSLQQQLPNSGRVR